MSRRHESETQLLRSRLQHLAEERLRALDALEMAGCVGSFDSSLNKLESHLPILRETAFKCHTLVPCSAMCFCLVDDENNDFAVDYCTPEDTQTAFSSEMEALIEDGDFAWALERNRPHIVRGRRLDGDLLLHTLTTASRIRGMFIAVLASERSSISDITLSLLSVVMNSCAHMLESFTLYSMLRADSNEMERRLGESREAQQHLDSKQQRLERRILQLEASLHEERKLRQKDLYDTLAMKSAVSDTAFDLALADLSGRLVEQVDPLTAARLALQVCIRQTGSDTGLLARHDPRFASPVRLHGSTELLRMCENERLQLALDPERKLGDSILLEKTSQTGFIPGDKHFPQGRHCLFVPLNGNKECKEHGDEFLTKPGSGFFLLVRSAERYSPLESHLVERIGQLLEPAVALLSQEQAA